MSSVFHLHAYLEVSDVISMHRREKVMLDKKQPALLFQICFQLINIP